MRCQIKPLKPVILVAVLLLSWTQPMLGQSLTGRIVDAENENSVGVAFVELLTADGDRITAGFTDDDGSFLLELTAAAEPTELVVGALGYESLTRDLLDLDLSADQDLGELLLNPAPIGVAPVDVVGQRRRVTPGREWIRQRQLLGNGKFFAGAVLEALDPSSLTTYLAEETGYWVSYDQRGNPSIRNPGEDCTLVYVNEWPMNRSVRVAQPVVGVRPAEREPALSPRDEQELGFPSLDRIPLEWIAAIEIYDDMREVPPGRLQLSGGRFHACAVINVWTWSSW